MIFILIQVQLRRKIEYYKGVFGEIALFDGENRYGMGEWFYNFINALMTSV